MAAAKKYGTLWLEVALEWSRCPEQNEPEKHDETSEHSETLTI